jgi:hypothetical protein
VLASSLRERLRETDDVTVVSWLLAIRLVESKADEWEEGKRSTVSCATDIRGQGMHQPANHVIHIIIMYGIQ